MKLDRITFVTGNKKKIDEITRILNFPIDILETDIDEIQEINLEKVALNKLSQAYELVKEPVIVDDISVEIKAWNNFPGPLIKWLLKAGDGDANMLLKLLKGEKNRSAVAKLAIGFHDGVEPHLFIGEVKGKIAQKITGKNGFGWDPVFIPEGHKQTFAQMSPELKDSLSHRGKALKKFKDFLNTNYDI